MNKAVPATETRVKHQRRLAARPASLPKASDWQLGHQPVTAPAEGCVLVRVLALSPDPAMPGAATGRLDELAPIAALVVEQVASRRHVAPAAARRRQARRGLGCQLLDQLDQAALAPLVSKRLGRQRFRCPRHHSNPSSNHRLAKDR